MARPTPSPVLGHEANDASAASQRTGKKASRLNSVLLLRLGNLRRRRTDPRFAAELPITVSWQSDRNHQLSGTIRNISGSGVFFEAEQEIPIGTKVELAFTLAAPKERFRCEGTVKRTERVTETKIGIGVQITKSELMNDQRRWTSMALFVALVLVLIPILTFGSSLLSANLRIELLLCAGALGLAALMMRGSKQKRPTETLLIVSGVFALGLTFAFAFSASRLFQRPHPPQPHPAGAPNVTVSVDTRTGLYYCQDSAVQGKRRSRRHETQEQAQKEGFHPAGGKACEVVGASAPGAASKQPLSKAASTPIRSGEPQAYPQHTDR